MAAEIEETTTTNEALDVVPRTSADVQQEIDRLETRGEALDRELEASRAAHGDAERQLADATYRGLVLDDAEAAGEAKTADKRLTTTLRHERDVLLTMERLESEITRLEHERDTLAAMERQKAIQAKCDDAIIVSGEIHQMLTKELTPLLDRYVGILAELDLTGSKRPGDCIAEALSKYFVRYSAEFRHLASVPSQARGFEDFVKRAGVRAERVA
jgi:hypothetical protein